jgi:CheY-like chemotaxis protein
MTSFLETAIGDNIDLQTVPARDLRVIRADPVQIEQILMNLCLNARDAMPRGGRLVIKTQNVEIDEEFRRIHPYGALGKHVLLMVSDTGEGMDASTLNRLFEPFFTTKELGRGTGLGLATVYGIVKQHGAFIDVDSKPAEGSTFRVYFPASSGMPHRRTAPPTQASGGTETVLLAEDDEGLRALAHEILTSGGYKVILARDGSEAIELFKENSGKIDLVFLDVVMPVFSGMQLSTRMRSIKPHIAVVYTTGYTQESLSLNSDLEAGAVFLQKPYSPQELLRSVRVALDRASST